MHCRSDKREKNCNLLEFSFSNTTSFACFKYQSRYSHICMTTLKRKSVEINIIPHNSRTKFHWASPKPDLFDRSIPLYTGGFLIPQPCALLSSSLIVRNNRMEPQNKNFHCIQVAMAKICCFRKKNHCTLKIFWYRNARPVAYRNLHLLVDV